MYVELQTTSHFSFLRGASHVEELFAQAASFGMTALGIADRGSLAGIVRAHAAGKPLGVRPVIGCRLDLTDAGSLLVYPTDRAAYSRLTRLLTIGKARAGKGRCALAWADLAAHAQGLIAILLPDDDDGDTLTARLRQLRETFGADAHVALTLRRRPGDAIRLHAVAQAARAAGVATVATGDVLYHHAERRILQDVLTCLRLRCSIDELGHRRERFAERDLKPPAEMARLFARFPDAVDRSADIAARCRFSLDELSYQYPRELSAPGESAQATLARLTAEGAQARYPAGVPDKVARLLAHELDLIGQLDYAPYFLTVRSIVAYARSRDILCQGRGSAANSAVCYVLGITAVDPESHDLLFERFISQERHEPPDIDVDFEHERREEVIQWIYETYGRHRAALCATVIRYRTRGALRDAGRALGLPVEALARLARAVRGLGVDDLDDATLRAAGFDPADRRLRLTLDLARALKGFPRHLSQHPGGFVLTEDRLDDLVPIEPATMENRQVIEWDKDDIDTLRFMKVDVLGLGMLGCMRRAFALLAQHKGLVLELATIPKEDAATYDMICAADTIGVFQIESRAQMAMLPRLKPRRYYDLVIEVAIVRPGPIQGGMVHPYLRRRDGKERVAYPHDDLRKVLDKTMGVPLFQEQAMQIAIVGAGFTPGEADLLRKSMATFKNSGTVKDFRDKLVGGMVARGYPRDFAERTFAQIEGFGSYGFPESHAASFAAIAYASSWMKCHHPDVFCAALLNAQPMGFYAPAQIIADARRHGVAVAPIDVNASRWDCTLEPAGVGRFAVRLGLRLVAGLSNHDAAALLAARDAGGGFADIGDLWRRAGVPVASLEKLAAADGLRPSLGLDRRAALWAIKGLRDRPLPLFARVEREMLEPDVALSPLTAGAEVAADYARIGFSLRAHPVSFLRDDLRARGLAPCGALTGLHDRARTTIAGLVLVRQRPGTAQGVTFVTIEDETGFANVVVWADLFARRRPALLAARLLAARGRVQREGQVVHLIADDLEDLTPLLARLAGSDQDIRVNARNFH